MAGRILATAHPSGDPQINHDWSECQQIRVNMGDGPPKALARHCLRRHRDRRGRLRKCPAFQRKHIDEA